MNTKQIDTLERIMRFPVTYYNARLTDEVKSVVSVRSASGYRKLIIGLLIFESPLFFIRQVEKVMKPDMRTLNLGDAFRRAASMDDPDFKRFAEWYGDARRQLESELVAHFLDSDSNDPSMRLLSSILGDKYDSKIKVANLNNQLKRELMGKANDAAAAEKKNVTVNFVLAD